MRVVYTHITLFFLPIDQVRMKNNFVEQARNFVYYATKNLEELQQQGIGPKGDVAILFNMIRVSAGGLIAFAHELKDTSGIDLNAPGIIDKLADMIVDVFLPLNIEQ